MKPTYEELEKELSILKGEKRNIESNFATVTDIIEHKKSEKDLKESDDKFKTIFDLSPIMMSLSDIKTASFLNVNDTWLRQFGFTREEVIGTKSADLNIFLNPSDRDEIVRMIMEKGFILNHEMQLRKKSGSIMNVIFSNHFIEFADNTLVLTSAVDITEKKEAEKAILEMPKPCRA